MEIIEIIVLIVLSIILGGLLLSSIIGWDYLDTFGAFGEKDSPEFRSVSIEEFAANVKELHEDCRNKGQDFSDSLYVGGYGLLDRKALFDVYKNLSWCESIQSSSEGCGQREDVVVDGHQLPRVFTIDCIDEVIYIR